MGEVNPLPFILVMKLQLTESQYSMLLEFQKRGYAFDWDDNILIMPTMIHLEKQVGKEWIPVDVSTEEFAEVRHNLGKNYRFLNDNAVDAFAEFRDYNAMLRDAEKAIQAGKFAPYFDKFKEALLYGNDFAIITARGNSPKSIKDTIKLIIARHFSEEEQKMMMDNLKGLTLQEYLNLQDYSPVSSDEYMQQYGGGSASNPEHEKMMSLERFVERVVQNARTLRNNPDFTGFSVGFSDDDLGNVKAAEEFIKKELVKKYPDVKFLVYDSSDPNNPKKNRIYLERL